LKVNNLVVQNTSESAKQWDFSGTRALYINCTLKRSPEVSNTEGLLAISRNIMEKHGIKTDLIRAVDHDIATGVWPDMKEHGWKTDEWPELYKKVMAADILVLCGPIWLGDNSSVMKRVIERLYGNSSLLNKEGQYAYYGKVGGCIPPQADAGWVGPAGPGPSYLDPGSGGPENDFTNRNTTFMSWNLMHIAHLLKANGGWPAYGNQRAKWDAGSRFDSANPEHR
jgi:multimeric flavodoxin WrbA